MSNLPSTLKNAFKSNEKSYLKFIEIIRLYDEQVSDPNSDMTMIFALENHIEFFCEKYNLDFKELRDKILEDKPLKYTDCVTNWVKKK